MVGRGEAGLSYRDQHAWITDAGSAARAPQAAFGQPGPIEAARSLAAIVAANAASAGAYR